MEQQLSSCWDGRPFGHNRHGPRSGLWRGAAVPLSVGGKMGPIPSNRMSPGPRPTSVPSGTASWFIQPFCYNMTTLQTGQRAGQWARSIGRTVTCNGSPKTACYHFSITAHEGGRAECDELATVVGRTKPWYTLPVSTGRVRGPVDTDSVYRALVFLTFVKVWLSYFFHFYRATLC